MSLQNMYKPADNFIHMSLKKFTWGIFGLVLGVIINNILVFLNNNLKIKYLLIQNILHLTLCSVFLSAIHSQYNYFGWTWQNLTPGLFFVSFFFGVQFKIFTNIQNTYILNNTKLLD